MEVLREASMLLRRMMATPAEGYECVTKPDRMFRPEADCSRANVDAFVGAGLVANFFESLMTGVHLHGDRGEMEAIAADNGCTMSRWTEKCALNMASVAAGLSRTGGSHTVGPVQLSAALAARAAGTKEEFVQQLHGVGLAASATMAREKAHLAAEHALEIEEKVVRIVEMAWRRGFESDPEVAADNVDYVSSDLTCV